MIVPEAPVVTVVVPERVTYLAGSHLLLSCSAQLHSSVDTEYNSIIQWYHNGEAVVLDERVTVSSPTLLTSHLQFSTLSSAVDNGTYTCAVTTGPVDEFSLWTSDIGSSLATISVSGTQSKLTIIMLTLSF